MSRINILTHVVPAVLYYARQIDCDADRAIVMQTLIQTSNGSMHTLFNKCIKRLLVNTFTQSLDLYTPLSHSPWIYF